MSLSRREGVDIRPTLLRVLTDLYVQTRAHSAEEEQQFVELASRLIEQVDDATRAAVRARLSVYPTPPLEIANMLGIHPSSFDRPMPAAHPIPVPEAPAPAARTPTEAELRMAASLAMRPNDAAEISEMFFAAGASERAQILHNLQSTPLKAAARIPSARAERALHILEMAAFAEDIDNFTREVGEALILPSRIAEQVVNDRSGEPLACAMKALGMPAPMFQRVLMFLNPEFGSSVNNVYRLARLYDHLTERSALIMLAAWRGSTMAVARAKYRPALYDDERNRARSAPSQGRPAVQPSSALSARSSSQNNSGR